jgi:archaellum biogenesis ATPase FlaH
LTGKEIHGDMRSVLPILEFIMSIIEEFMDENEKGVVILDGLEYLLTNNKFNSVLRFLRQLVDNVSQTECILLVSLSPDALDQTEVTLLEKDLLPINYQSK